MLDQWCDHYANVFKLQYLTGLRVQDAIKEDDKTYLDIDHSLFFWARHLGTICQIRLKLSQEYARYFYLSKRQNICEIKIYMHVTKKHIKTSKIRSLRSINSYNTKKRYLFQYRFKLFFAHLLPIWKSGISFIKLF